MPIGNFKNNKEILQYLDDIGDIKDEDINIFKSALAFSCISNPGISADKYLNHMDKIFDQLDKYWKQNIGGGLTQKIEAINHIIYNEFHYSGDKDNYDDLQNLSIAKVIDRRLGIPISLGIIYISIGLKFGLDIKGLNFPGHFLIRASEKSERIIIDPFRHGAILNAPDLRAILKSILGENAELSHEFHETVSNREILIRLQNNLKSRLITSEDYAQAIKITELMCLIDKQEYRLFLDLGVLNVKIGKKDMAINYLNKYISATNNEHEKIEAQMIIDQIE